MELLSALFNLLRISSRLAEWGEHVRAATRKGVLVGSMVAGALLMSAVGLCLLLVALDQALVPYLGEAGTALLLAVLLFLASAVIYTRATSFLKSPAKPPVKPLAPNAAPGKPEEMSNAALLALLGGIVLGAVMHGRSAAPAPPKE